MNTLNTYRDIEHLLEDMLNTAQHLRMNSDNEHEEYDTIPESDRIKLEKHLVDDANTLIKRMTK